MSSKFRTTEISDPQFESDNLRFITVKTQNLKGRGDICTYIPPNIKSKVNTPLLILLHGVYGNSWIWSQKGGAHHTANQLISEEKIKPMVIAMPSDGLWGDGSAYLPHNDFDFEKWIVEDVIAAVKENIDGVTDNSPIFISGLSMGGYGALRLGAKYPHLFKGFSGMSSITDLPQMELFVEEDVALYEQKDESNASVLKLMLKNKDKLSPFRFDCGVDDELIAYNRNLTKALDQAGISHIYEEFEGKHEWVYWQIHLKDSLLFFNSLLK